MQLYEFQAKKIFEQNGISIPRGRMAQTASEAEDDDLLSGGTLLVDPDMVKEMPRRSDIEIIGVPATRTAEDLLGQENRGKHGDARRPPRKDENRLQKKPSSKQ